MASNPKVLIIDDEIDFAAFEEKLEARSYAVTTARNREQAQKLLKTDRPDALVLGTITPRGDACRLYQWLKQSSALKNIPVLVLDAFIANRMVKGWLLDEIRMLEADDIIAKPVELESLADRIEGMLRKTARKRIKVLVVDDHTVVREGICAMLALQKDIEVVGQARDGLEAVQRTHLLSPDVVVMDISMPNMDGLEAAGKISKECPWTKILILTQYEDADNVVTAARQGVYGFIPKRSASSELVIGIRRVFSGEYFMGPLATKALMEAEQRHKEG